MSPSDDKKKLLDIRLNESNPLHTLRVAQQSHIQTDSHHSVPDNEPVWTSPEASITEVEKTQSAPSPDDTFFQTSPVNAAASSDMTAEADTIESKKQPDTRSLPHRIFDRVLYSLSGIVPKRGDSVLEILRKCVFVVALIALIASVSYIFNDMVIEPTNNKIVTDKVSKLYNPQNPVDPPADFTGYPDGIQPQFKALYAQNQDIRGWISYADSQKSWLDIDYPVVYSGDNDYYLRHDFYKENNINGEPFLDYRNKIDSASSHNKVTIIYGHDMGSGQMFHNLNKLLSSVNYARTAPTINFDTIYSKGSQYKVFAVMLLNNNDQDGPKFDYLRTDFANTKDFMDYIANIRARSLYSYNDVDVQPDDDLLVLSTCSETSIAKFTDSRCAVIARKVRTGETVAVNTSNILKNDNVIMPLAWYKNQNKTPHPFYTDPNYIIPGLWTDASGTSTTNTITTTQGSPTTLTGDLTTKSSSSTSVKASTGTTLSPATEPTNPNSETSSQTDDTAPSAETTSTAEKTTSSEETTTTTKAPETTPSSDTTLPPPDTTQVTPD